MNVCKRVYYSGRVQGVGFRYSTQRIAAKYPVAGHVRNLRNGDVELVAEGPADEVEAFLKAVAGRMAPYIERTMIHEEKAADRHGFRIEH